MAFKKYKNIKSIIASSVLIISSFAGPGAFADSELTPIPVGSNKRPQFELSLVDLTNNKLDFGLTMIRLPGTVLNFGAWIVDDSGVEDVADLDEDALTRVFWSNDREIDDYYKYTKSSTKHFVVSSEVNLAESSTGKMFYMAVLNGGTIWAHLIDYSDCLSGWTTGKACAADTYEADENKNVTKINYILTDVEIDEPEDDSGSDNDDDGDNNNDDNNNENENENPDNPSGDDDNDDESSSGDDSGNENENPGGNDDSDSDNNTGSDDESGDNTNTGDEDNTGNTDNPDDSGDSDPDDDSGNTDDDPEKTDDPSDSDSTDNTDDTNDSENQDNTDDSEDTNNSDDSEADNTADTPIEVITETVTKLVEVVRTIENPSSSNTLATTTSRSTSSSSTDTADTSSTADDTKSVDEGSGETTLEIPNLGGSDKVSETVDNLSWILIFSSGLLAGTAGTWFLLSNLRKTTDHRK